MLDTTLRRLPCKLYGLLSSLIIAWGLMTACTRPTARVAETQPKGQSPELLFADTFALHNDGTSYPGIREGVTWAMEGRWRGRDSVRIVERIYSLPPEREIAYWYELSGDELIGIDTFEYSIHDEF